MTVPVAICLVAVVSAIGAAFSVGVQVGGAAAETAARTASARLHDTLSKRQHDRIAELSDDLRLVQRAATAAVAAAQRVDAPVILASPASQSVQAKTVARPPPEPCDLPSQVRMHLDSINVRPRQ
jgi:hypothetical protein